MKKITLEIHPGYWNLLPHTRSKPSIEHKDGWYKEWKNSPVAKKRVSFLCFSLYLEKDVKETEYTEEWQSIDKKYGTS